MTPATHYVCESRRLIKFKTKTTYDFQIIGCQPERSKVMYECVQAGHVLFEESGETLSDGTAGGVEEGSVGLLTLFFLLTPVHIRRQDVSRYNIDKKNWNSPLRT